MPLQFIWQVVLQEAILFDVPIVATMYTGAKEQLSS